MLKYIGLFLLLILIEPAFAQTAKIYLTNDGRISNEPLTASAFMLIQKINDTLYSAEEYDMRDTILLSGKYKDASLATPNGKFSYYNKPKFNKSYYHSPVDTTNFIQLSGTYVNGLKEGVWVLYIRGGEKQVERYYKNDKLDGPFITYTPSSGEWTKEDFVDGVSTGTTYTYNEDSVLMWENHMENGRPGKVITHLEGGEPKYDFESYLESKLKPYKQQLKTAKPMIKFIITTEGKLTRVTLTQGVSAEVDSAVVEAILSAPPFTPTRLDGKIIEFKSDRQLFLFQNNRMPFRDSRHD